MAEKPKAKTADEIKELVVKAVRGGAPTIYEISIVTGLAYHTVVKAVLDGLGHHTFRLVVNEQDGRPDKPSTSRSSGA